MNEDVNVQQESVIPVNEPQSQKEISDKEINFRRLEAAREAEKEARIRAEMQAEMLRREVEEIKTYLQPKEIDPLDSVEDYVDPKTLRIKLEKERAAFERKAEEIAKKTFEKLERQKNEQEKGRFLEKLRDKLPDYDQVVNESTLIQLDKIDPVFLRAVSAVPDEYERRLMTYQKLKSLPRAEEKPSIKEKVAENQQNPYYIPTGSGTPTGGIDFDISSKDARAKAYDKLKQAQRNPIGIGQGSIKR